MSRPCFCFSVVQRIAVALARRIKFYLSANWETLTGLRMRPRSESHQSAFPRAPSYRWKRYRGTRQCHCFGENQLLHSATSIAGRLHDVGDFGRLCFTASGDLIDEPALRTLHRQRDEPVSLFRVLYRLPCPKPSLSLALILRLNLIACQRTNRPCQLGRC